MEAFSLLKYWRTNADAATTNADVTTSTATTIVTTVSCQTSEPADEEDDENDHGPFFDLVFSLPSEEDEGGEDELVKLGETEISVDYGDEDEEEEDCDGSEEVEDERDLKFTLLTDTSGGSTAEVNASSDDFFFNGSFAPVEQTEEIDSKPLQTRASLMKSATKLRVMMLNFKKSKTNASDSSNSKEEQKKEEPEKADRSGESEDSGKSTTVKCTVDDAPIVSLFKRHNSSKAPKKKQNNNESVSASSEEKKFSKETMQKYLKKVKPLYVRVSKRYIEKFKLTGNLNSLTSPSPSPSPSPATEDHKQSPATNPRREKGSNPEVTEPPLLPINVKGLKQSNLPAGLRVVCKHLRNSRSAFTAVAAAPPGAISSNRHDDSLLQQQDGIQSAILHCKRSFKASRDSDCSSSSASDPATPYDECGGSLFSGAADGDVTEKMNKR